MSTRRLHKFAGIGSPTTGRGPPGRRNTAHRTPLMGVVTHARNIRPDPHRGGGARLRPGAAAHGGNADPSRAPPRLHVPSAPPAPGRVPPGEVRTQERGLGPPVHDGAYGDPHRRPVPPG